MRAERDNALANANKKEQTIKQYEKRDQHLVAAIRSLREEHMQQQETLSAMQYEELNKLLNESLGIEDEDGGESIEPLITIPAQPEISDHGFEQSNRNLRLRAHGHHQE